MVTEKRVFFFGEIDKSWRYLEQHILFSVSHVTVFQPMKSQLVSHVTVFQPMKSQFLEWKQRRLI